jgi:HAD superfamily hydrolase (TIGR01450 family)
VTGRPARQDGERSQPLLTSYAALICDLDGVVHRGATAIEGAPEALAEAASSGVRVLFVTNNAARTPADVAAHLSRLGVNADAADVVTSAQAGAARVREMVGEGERVLALGGPGVAAALSEHGLTPVEPGAGPVRAVLQGYGPELTVADFTEAARQLSSGVVWVATNIDLTIPFEWGPGPGNGSYVNLLAEVAGRRPDAAVGKPDRPLYDQAVESLAVDRDRVLAAGDRLDTDIDGAAAAGIDSAWVLTGVHRPSDLVAALDRTVPTYVLASLHELHEPYAAPHRSGDGWLCGSHRCALEVQPAGEARLTASTVRANGDEVEVPLDGPVPIEVVRAGLAALLEARAAGATPPAALVSAARALDARVEGRRPVA